MQDIIEDLRDAIDRSGMTQQQIAREMYLSNSNITNWITKNRPIPLKRLKDIMNFLDDEKFRYQVAEYVSGVPLYSHQSLSVEMPQAWYFSSKKEESERKALDEDINILFNKPVSEVTKDDKMKAQKYLKELSEEIESENSLKLSIFNVLSTWERGKMNYGNAN